MLYIVATPIGNLNDISFRAIEVLKKVDLILCEDTRRTSKLLFFYKINTKVLSYHQHSKIKKINYILELLEDKTLALVCDAGTPGISDPGNKLVNLAIAKINKLEVVPIPGPSSVTACLSVSGFPCDKFLFLGFCPKKKHRQLFFQNIVDSKQTIVFFESVHRIIKTLNNLNDISELSARQIMVAREITKKFEKIYRGTIKQVLLECSNDSKINKGEIVIAISSK
ncbi:16S rRNA (cytidine(1402)-2'-O)-methyltransferase [Patescibacteria group bacterium]|nr:16S rRNA (cytidine(1402)-2'-O)-methyltransferase [Patescibacteria group bacterium]